MARALSNKKGADQLYFETVGTETTGNYDIYINHPNGNRLLLHSILNNKIDGLKEARIYICNYIIRELKGNSETEFNQYCVSPLRDDSKNVWCQFKVSQFI